MPERTLHRSIVERYVITGKLVLETPAHFGNGEADAFTDMPLLKDELDGKTPLLPGTSIAGALRNYLRERQRGDWFHPPKPPTDNSNKEEARFKQEMEEERSFHASLLFGGSRGDEDGNQSPLIVHDALGSSADYELRDSVRIEPETRTAEDEKKFDITLLTAGTSFDLRFDLSISLPNEDQGTLAEHRLNLLSALAAALTGLQEGEITLGARKRRGFGRCRVTQWTVTRYDVQTRAGLLAWLAEDYPHWSDPAPPPPPLNNDINALLGADTYALADKRQRFAMSATFALDGSLMVRSGQADSGPDMIHLHSPRPQPNGGSEMRPIVAGTTWAGVLRSRATQIGYTLAPLEKGKETGDKVAALIDGIFGPAKIESRRNQQRNNQPIEAKASRLALAETEIGDEGIRKLEQTRIKIDRFTGGAFESALFSEQPLFGNQDSQVRLEISLRLPVQHSRLQQHAEVGLLLLLLKDLWTGDLPIGGESGIGRGRLQGKSAEIRFDGTWAIAQTDTGNLAITGGEPAVLQGYVTALNEWLKRMA